MKSAFVAALEPEQAITTCFLVCEKQVRGTRGGKPALRAALWTGARKEKVGT